MKIVLIFIWITLNCCNSTWATDTSILKTYSIHADSINKKNKNYVDNILFYSKEILTIFGLLFGLGLGLPFLNRKLKEQQFSKIINDIYIANRAVKKEILPFIDEAITKTYENNILEKEELNEILEKIQQIQKKANNSSSQVISYLFLAKKLFQILKSDYDKNSTITLGSREIYGLLISILSEIDFFATNVVNLKTFGFKSLIYAKEELRPYCIDYRFKVFKTPPQGLYISTNSIITIQFIQAVLSTKNYFICRSAFKIIGNSKPIARLLLLNKIYFPVRLKEVSKEEKPFGPFELHLVSFRIMTRWYSSSPKSKSIVLLTYSNISNSLNYTKSIKIEDIKKSYVDDYLETDWIKFAEFTEIKHNEPECISMEIEENVLNSFFDKYSSKLRKKMKYEIRRKNK